MAYGAQPPRCRHQPWQQRRWLRSCARELCCLRAAPWFQCNGRGHSIQLHKPASAVYRCAAAACTQRQGKRAAQVEAFVCLKLQHVCGSQPGQHGHAGCVHLAAQHGRRRCYLSGSEPAAELGCPLSQLMQQLAQLSAWEALDSSAMSAKGKQVVILQAAQPLEGCSSPRAAEATWVHIIHNSWLPLLLVALTASGRQTRMQLRIHFCP